jgi:thymidine kinase
VPSSAAELPADGLIRIAAVIRIPPQRGGWLEVICGPMFSGKSEEMIRRLRRAEIAGQRVVIFKPQIDDRYDATDVVSHAGARMRAVPVTCVAEIAAHAQSIDVVGIDEAQFLGEGVVSMALDLADGGTRVIVAGLDQDFRRLPFGRCRRSSRTPSSWTSCRPSVTAAAVRRRRRSGS